MILRSLLAFATLPIFISKRCWIRYITQSQREAVSRFLDRFPDPGGPLECFNDCVNGTRPCTHCTWYTYDYTTSKCRWGFTEKYPGCQPSRKRQYQQTHNRSRQLRKTNQFKQTQNRERQLRKTQSSNLSSSSRKKSKKKRVKSKKKALSDVEGCNKGYTYFTKLNICVKIHGSKRSWNTARKICISEKSHLAIINDSRKKRVLHAYMKSAKTFDCFWIGAKDVYENNTYFWLDNTKMAYSNWAWREPSHVYFGADEDCVSLRGTTKWNDCKCSKDCKFICETKPNT